MKKISRKAYVPAFVSLALSVSLVACSSSSTAPVAPETTNTNAGVTTPAAAQPESIDKANTDPLKVTLAGGSVGGFWSGLGQVISKSFADTYPGSAATYEPGSGAGNIKLIDEQQVEIGLVQNVEVVAAQNGLAPFAKKYDEMMAIGTIYNNAYMQISVRKNFADQYGVKSLADIAAKKVPARIAINQQGNLNSLAAHSALTANGITEKDLKDWGGSLTWAGSTQRWDAMGNQRMDITIDFVFAPDAKVQEKAVHTSLELWSIDQKTADAMKTEWDLPAQTIPKGTYEFQQEDVFTVGISGIILVSQKVSPTDQYKMAKALVEQLSIIQALHPAMKDMTAEQIANTGSIPLAPGAKEFFQEIRAIK